MTTVYRFYDDAGDLLYVGIANNVISRTGQHAATKEWFGQVARATFEHYQTRAEAAAREKAVIRSEHPRHNVRNQLDITKVAVALKQRQMDRLQRLAAAEGQSVSFYVRHAIERTYPATDDEEREEAIA